MTIQHMEHVGIVVDDLGAATAFFVELGLELQGDRAGRRRLGRPRGGARGRPGGVRDGGDPGRPRSARAGEVPLPLGPQATGTRRRTPWASAMSHSLSTTSTPPSPPCEPAAVSSSARWRTTKTSIASATSAARRGSSSSWRSGSAERLPRFLESTALNPSGSSCRVFRRSTGTAIPCESTWPWRRHVS